MKKISLYLTLALAGLFMGSCSDDYKDWADPQSNAQEDAITIPGFTASAVDAINLANVTTDSVATFKLSTANLPDGYTLGNARIELTPTGVENATTTTVSTSLTGATLASTLQSLITSTYGKRPTARTFSAHVYLNAVKDGQACLIDAGTINVILTPTAPEISNAYYIVGGALDFGASAKSKEQKFSHSSKDVYDDPVFSIVIKAKEGDDTWFAIGSEEACDAITNNNDWSQLLGTTSGNGKNGLTGSLDKRSKLSDDGSFCISKDYGAKYIKVDINMMDYTYTITPLNFAQYMYVAGDGNGWSQIDYMSTSAYDGKYTGYMYLSSQYKLCTQQNWNGPNYGEGFSTDGGAANMTLSTPGYYKVDADLVGKTIKLTAITTIGLIGDATAGGWGTSTPMTYNQKDRCWETTATVTNGSFKFRANDGWDINWGGTTSALKQGGDNISISAGTYDFKLFAWCDGKAYCEITKK
jgi:hypothetical protein